MRAIASSLLLVPGGLLPTVVTLCAKPQGPKVLQNRGRECRFAPISLSVSVRQTATLRTNPSGGRWRLAVGKIHLVRHLPEDSVILGYRRAISSAVKPSKGVPTGTVRLS